LGITKGLSERADVHSERKLKLMLLLIEFGCAPVANNDAYKEMLE
jgi:hypothetical protein